jgi:cysteine desulfurase/selenocysteine lyase
VNTVSAAQAASADLDRVRADFPALNQQISGHPLAYLDNGASTQKPSVVIEAVSAFYRKDYANVHRGIHTLSQRATDRYEGARVTVRDFLGADRHEEIIFTSGTTESINLVAQSYGRGRLGEGDEVLVSTLEHHSNIVPWQMVCEQTGARLRVIPINDSGELEMGRFEELLSEHTRIVAITHISNALGTVVPLKTIIDAAHRAGAIVLIDGAQAIAHLGVNVAELDCDFYAFSGHKVFGPTGVGVLYGKYDLLDAMPPYQGGGDMIKTVSFEKTVYNDVPYKFEAGTPNIAGVIGLAVALDYTSGIGTTAISDHEQNLLAYASKRALEIPGLKIIGTAADKVGILSFQVDGLHSADIGTLLDHQGVAIRVGHHCAMPVMERFGLNSTCRASLAMYNNEQDIDALISGLEKARKLLA